VDEAEVDVTHGRAGGDRDGKREEADPALRVQRAVDRIDHDERLAAADRADLLGDDR